MKRKYLLLLLASITSFATTGNFKFNFEPYVEVNKSKEVTQHFSLPYEINVNFDEQNVYLGVNGTYNKKTPMGTFQFLKNEMDIWGKYVIAGDVHSGFIKIDNDISTSYESNKFDGSVKSTLTGGYKYKINDMLTYDLVLKYKGNKLVASPDFASVDNKLTIDKDYEVNLNLKQQLAGDIKIFTEDGYLINESKATKEFSVEQNKFLSNTIIDINGKMTKKGFSIEPGYTLNVYNGEGFVSKLKSSEITEAAKIEDIKKTKENEKATYTFNEIKLNLGYSDDYKVLKLSSALNNKVSFGVMDNKLIQNTIEALSDFSNVKDDLDKKSYKVVYEINPKFEISRAFEFTSVTVTPKLNLEGKAEFAFGDKNSFIKSSSFNINPNVDLQVKIIESVIFLSKVDLGFNFKQSKHFLLSDTNDFGFDNFNIKINLGLNYKW